MKAYLFYGEKIECNTGTSIVQVFFVSNQVAKGLILKMV